MSTILANIKYLLAPVLILVTFAGVLAGGIFAWLGVALLPQAGVAIGMALVASNIFIQHSQLLLTVVISTTIFFEIIGPILTHIAISRVHKAHVKNTRVEDHAGS